MRNPMRLQFVICLFLFLFFGTEMTKGTPSGDGMSSEKADVLTVNNRPEPEKRLFRSEAVEKKIGEVTRQ